MRTRGGWSGQYGYGGGGMPRGDGELVERLAAALRRVLEAAPAFDRLERRRDELTTWESAAYRAAKDEGWRAVDEAGRATGRGRD